jgi:hypothetical protein
MYSERRYSSTGIELGEDVFPLLQFYSAPWFRRLWVGLAERQLRMRID